MRSFYPKKSKMGQAINVKYEMECRVTLYTPTYKIVAREKLWLW